MSCSRYRFLISRYLDDGLSLRERDALLSHVGNCPSCAAVLARYRAIEVSLRKLPESRPSPAVREELLRKVKEGGSLSWRGVGSTARGVWRFGLPGVMGADLQVLRQVRVAVMAATLVIALAGILLLLASGPGSTNSGSALLHPNVSVPSAPQPLSASLARPDFAPAKTSYVAAALEQMLWQERAERLRRLPLPAYLPAGMRLERFSVNASYQPDATEDLEVAYRAQDGKMVRIRHTVDDTNPAVSQAARPVVVRGHEWWFEKHPTTSSDGAQVYILFTRRNDEVIVLDAVLPLDELMRIVESIEWVEEER